MASLITHAVAAVGLGGAIAGWRMPARFWAAAVACSCLPDADAIGYFLGVPYEHALGHRGFSHSLLFALLVGALAAPVASWPRAAHERVKLAALLAAITASHGLLDALTDGGLGIAFFWPFDSTRYFLPWRPIAVSPIGIRAFLSTWGLRVLASEAAVVWSPIAVAAGIATWLRHRFPAGSTNQPI